MARIRTAAVVLKVLDHGESDKIVTFYCRTAGKLTGIAKGAKRSARRFVNKLEIFSWLDISFDPRNQTSLVYIAEAELLQPFITLRSNYSRYTAASLLIEHVLNWTRENDADEQLFSLLTWALSSLDNGLPPLSVVIFFLTKLFHIVGYRPYFSGCIKCNHAGPDVAPFAFQPARSGLVCHRCCAPGPTSPASIPLSLGTIRLLANVQDMPLAKLHRLQISAPSTREAIRLLRKYGEHLLQREIHSWKALS